MSNSNEIKKVEDNEESKYRVLHERGVRLDDESIEYILKYLGQGVGEVLDYFKVSKKQLELFFLDDMEQIGYTSGTVSQWGINVPVNYLNHIADSLESSKSKIGDILIDVDILGEKAVPFYLWLKSAGREEAIHHLQRVGCEGIVQNLPQSSKYMELDKLSALLCAHEVEARKLSDKVGVLHGDTPLWDSLDAFLQEHYPDKYNLPFS